MRRLIAPLLAALALSACAATPTLYQAAAGPRAVGFTDTRIETDRYRITFQGGPGAPAEQVADMALLRAADLAIEQGYDWFRVTDRYTRTDRPGGGSTLSVGAGSGSFGRHSAFGLGLGTSFDLGGGPAFSQTLEILLGKGQAPRDTDVYVAREVRQMVAPRV